METALIVKFLTHLISCAESVMSKEEIDSDDIVRIRREIVEFKRHIDGKEKIDLVVLDQILGLDFRVDESLLGDSRRSLWRLLAKTLFHRSPLVEYESIRRLEKLKRQIADFRDVLDHLRFAIEFQKMPSQIPGPTSGAAHH